MNHKTLPCGYRFAQSIDCMRNKSQIKAMLILSVALIVAPVVIGLIAVPIGPSWQLMASRWWAWPALGAALIAYIPLHELTHGAVMLALSGVMPSFGLKLPYAYAGSTVWFDKKSHILTLLQIMIARLPAAWFWPLWIVQISNLSGSAGDIYTAWYLARMKGDLLIQDTGVRMSIAKRIRTEEESL